MTDPRQLALPEVIDLVDERPAGPVLPPVLHPHELRMPMPRRSSVEAYLTTLESEQSKRVMGVCLESMATMATGGQLSARQTPWHLMREDYVERLKERLLARYGTKPATVNLHLSALRGVLRQAWLAKLMSVDDYHRAKAVSNAKGQSTKGQPLTLDQLETLFRIAASAGGAIGVRDTALLALLYGAGLRRSEAAAVELVDVHLDTNTLDVHGKGRKERMVPLGGEVRAYLEAWIARRGPAPGALLLPIHKAGHILRGRLTGQAFYNRLRHLGRKTETRLRQLGQLAAHESLDLSPHRLRHSTATHMLDEGIDLAAVGAVLGHTSVQTTVGYDGRGDRAKRSAVRALRVPWISPEG